jgi:hypothetical protein
VQHHNAEECADEEQPIRRITQIVPRQIVTQSQNRFSRRIAAPSAGC